MYDPLKFLDKYQLALEASLESKPEGGLCGFELEWNLLDSKFRPLLTVGYGPGQQSFVDYLREEHLSPWLRQLSQLEVFHWMIEWATRPYYSPRMAVYEGRLMEAVLINTLYRAGRRFGDQLYAWHGNLLFYYPVSHESIPGSWHLAKRRYLERCVDLYGDSLATAGMHTNLSLPDALFAWDFMHASALERRDRHLDDYKSEFYITATRLMRAFAAMFIATSASTPLQAQLRDGKPVVVISEIDSVRNLTFPNPTSLDLPDLYRSYEDYLKISYDLVRKGIRFGNNNWTPVRARSFAEPVERLIAVTSEQLQKLYARGLYAAGQVGSIEEMANQIEIQNLMARINLPMARVEVRTDDPGHPMDVDVANLTLKHLLMIKFFADPEFARAFRYDQEDILRARRNEEKSARFGLRAEIENPFNAKPIRMRDFLQWTLEEVRTLAEGLDLWQDLIPLFDMATGGPNTSERLRARLREELGDLDEVPLELLRALAEERVGVVSKDVSQIIDNYSIQGAESFKISEFLKHALDDMQSDPQLPIRFRPRNESKVDIVYSDKTSEIIDLAWYLIEIPSITVGAQERLEEVHRAAIFIYDYLRDHGLEARLFNESKYPAVLAGFPGRLDSAVMLAGHFDVVSPEPDENQLLARIEGDYLWGRGAADMKTVVATYLVWFKDTLRETLTPPAVNLLLVGNEENGEIESTGTPHVMKFLAGERDNEIFNNEESVQYQIPRLLIAGERTGEEGNELWGDICIENRGLIRFEITARGKKGHSSIAGRQADLSERLTRARFDLLKIFKRYLTLVSEDGWQSQVSFPFIQVGVPGIYNVTADYGVLGVEVRPIPQDDIWTLRKELEEYCHTRGLELNVPVYDNGVACDRDNPYLQMLVEAVRQESGLEPRLGRKLPGTSARFAPDGQGIVWGQSGLDPHGREERHYIPSILPYFKALQRYGRLLSGE